MDQYDQKPRLSVGLDFSLGPHEAACFDANGALIRVVDVRHAKPPEGTRHVDVPPEGYFAGGGLRIQNPNGGGA